MEYLMSTKLNILNRGNKYTLVINNRTQVIDLTLGTYKIGDLLSNWHVSDEVCQTTYTYYFKWVTSKFSGSHKMALTCYNKKIRTAKQSSRSNYYLRINDVPDKATLMKITAILSANRVSFIKLPDG